MSEQRGTRDNCCDHLTLFKAKQVSPFCANATTLPSIIIFLYFQLDKASIVRLTIAYLRLRDFANHGDPPWNRDGRFDGKATLKSKDFLYVLRDYIRYTVCFNIVFVQGIHIQYCIIYKGLWSRSW